MALPEVPPIEDIVLTNPLPYDVAVLVDNVVYTTMNLDGNQAAIYLAQPTFVQVEYAQVRAGQIYDPATGTFSDPA